MTNEKTNIILPLNYFFRYSLLALALSVVIAFSPIWGIWLAISLILAIWTKDDDRRFLATVIISMIFGPIGRWLLPGTIVGSLWAFDPLIGFGLLLRFRRFWPIRIDREALWRVSTPSFFVIFSVIGLFGSCFVFPLVVVLKGALYTVRWLGYYLVIQGLENKEDNEDQESKDFWKTTLLIATIVLAVLGFGQLLLLPAISKELVHSFALDPHIGRLFATWFDPNYLGGFLVVALLLNLDKGKDNKKIQKVKMAKIFWLATVLLAVLLTFSRSSYLALVVGLLIFFSFRSPKVILLIVAASVALVLSFTPVRQRVLGAVNLDITARQRIESYQNAWQIIKTNPIVGVGYNLYGAAGESVGLKYKKYNQPYQPAAGGSDSSLLTIWATAGLGGLIIYLLLIWKICYLGSVGKKSAIAALFVHSLFVNSLLLPPMMIVFWIIFKMTNDKC